MHVGAALLVVDAKDALADGNFRLSGGKVEDLKYHLRKLYLQKWTLHKLDPQVIFEIDFATHAIQISMLSLFSSFCPIDLANNQVLL